MHDELGEIEFHPNDEAPTWDEVPGWIPLLGEANSVANWQREVEADPDNADVFEELGVEPPMVEEVTFAAYDASGNLVSVLFFNLTEDFEWGTIATEVWVVTRPGARRQGHATRLYAEARRLHYPIETGSDYSLNTGGMTADGYAFMRGRRAKRGEAA